jgi:hypothetical protein
MSALRLQSDQVEPLISSLLPVESVRSACLQIFARALVAANCSNPSGWGITPYADRVRLVVGHLVACTLHKGSIWVVLHQPAGKGTVRTALADVSAWRDPQEWEWWGIPVVAGYYTPVGADWTLARQMIERLNAEFAAEAVAKWRTLPVSSQRCHSPAVLDYLRQTLGRDLPNPGFRLP